MLKFLLLFLFLFGEPTTGQKTPAEAQALDICTICICHNPIINCQNQGLTSPNYTWPDWKNSEVHLEYNFITHLTKFPVSKTSNLSLAHNRIRHIEDEAFQDLEFLVDLNLSNNYLTDLLPQIFYGHYDLEHYRPMKLLRILDLSHNAISSLHQDLFIHLPNLEDLDLSYNPMKIIDDKTRMALSKIPYIKVLDLSYTGIGHLPEYFLHNSYYLRTLNLKGNNFTQVPAGFLSDGHDLTYINLDENPVQRLATGGGDAGFNWTIPNMD